MDLIDVKDFDKVILQKNRCVEIYINGFKIPKLVGIKFSANIEEEVPSAELDIR